MEGERVTGSPSIDEDWVIDKQPSSNFRYGDKFEELCGYYMSIGMSYYDYWDGDNCMTKYYRKMDEYNKERKNYELWLQGAYFYEAILDASPTLNSFSKNHTPFPYRSKPFPVNEDEAKQQYEQDKHKHIDNSNQAMQIIMTNFNMRFGNMNKQNINKENVNVKGVDNGN